MKKTLAILLTLIFTFSCFSILGTVSAEETPTTNVVFTDFTDFSDTSIWGGSNVKIVDENSDGVKDFARLDTTANKKTAYIASKTFTLVPGTEYEISCYVRVPSTSALHNDGTTKQAPRFIIYQTDAEENGKPTISYGEGKHDYAYKGKGTEDNILRRKAFESYWTIGDSDPINRPAYSSCSDTMFYSAYPDKTPNEVFEDWTKVTATFTAIDDENNVGPETVSFRVDLKNNRIANAQVDVKDLKVIDKSIVVPEVLPEGVIVDEDFEDTDDATTVIKDGSNANWEKIEVTDTEAANGKKSASVFAPYVKLYIPLNKSLLKANTEYKFSMNWKMLEYNADTAKNTLKNLRLAGWNPSEGQACKDATKLVGVSNVNATGEWINATFNFTISDLEAYEEFIISFDYQATKAADETNYTPGEDSIFIDDILVIDASKEVEPEEPVEPDDTEGEPMDFEDVTKWRGNGYKSTQLAGYTGHVTPEEYVEIKEITDPAYILDGDSSIMLDTNTRWYDYKLTGLKSNTKYALKFSYLVDATITDKNLINVYGIFNYAASGAKLDKASTSNAEGYLNCVYTNGYAFLDNNGEGTVDYRKDGVREITTKDKANVWYTATVYFNTTEVKDTLALVIKTNYNNTYLDKFQLVEVDYTNPAQDVSAPVIEGKTKKGPFETENTTSYLYYDCDATDYAAYLTTLENNGFVKYSTNAYGSNEFAVYTKGNTTVNVAYTPNNGTILASENATDTLPTTKEQNVYENKGIQPLIIQLDHNNKTNGGIGMSYIIRLADGSFIIVDGGHTETQYDNANIIYNKLREYAPTGEIKIAAWFITHCHSDHIGGFISFVERYSNEVNIEQVIYNTATYEQFVGNAEMQSGKATQQEPILLSYINQDVFTATIALLKLNGTKISTCHSGYKYNIRNAVIDIMFTLEDVFPNVFGVNMKDANNTTTVFKVSFTDENVDQTLLITGDSANPECTAMYAKYTGDELKSTFVQAIHHGISCGTYELYEKMDPEVVLWPGAQSRVISQLYQAQNQYFVSENSNVKEIVLSDYGTRTFALPYTAPEGLTGIGRFTIPDDIENANALDYYFGVSIRKAEGDTKQALRFKIGMPVQILEGQTTSGYKVVEYGTMVSESANNLNYYSGNSAYVKNNGVKTFKAEAYNKKTNKNIVFDYYNYSGYDDGVHRLTDFTCALNNIGVGKDGKTDYTKYDTTYYARVYVVFENAEGDTKIYYGATQSASVFATMLTILKNNSNADDVAYVKSFINGQVDGFTADAEAIKAAWNSSTDRKNYYVQ